MDGEENMQKFVNSHIAIIYDLQKSALSSKHVCGARHCNQLYKASPVPPSPAGRHHIIPPLRTLPSLMFGGMDSVVSPSRPPVSSPVLALTSEGMAGGHLVFHIRFPWP